MTRSQALSGAALLLGVLCGCRSDQPLAEGRQLLQINIVAIATVDCLVDTWDRYLDVNLNNQVDVGVDERRSPKCTEDSDSDGQPDCVAAGGTVAVPVPFGVRISVVRAGTSVRQDLTAVSAISTTLGVGRTNYTEQPPVVGQTPGRDPEPCIDTPGTCVFGNPRRVPVTNVDAANCILPPGDQRAAAHIGDQSPPFSIDVGSGDVVIVQAQAGGALSGQPTQFQFMALTALDGITVTPVGVFDSGQGQGAGAVLSFSYTVR